MLMPQRGRSTLSLGRSPGLRRLSIIGCCSVPLRRSVNSTGGPSSCVRGLSAGLAWFVPDLVGGGDPITQRTLVGADTLGLLPLVFLLRLGLGAISYAAGTPGGLFAPMLVLGAQLGLFFGQLCQLVFPDLNIQPEGFAVVGMAAFFTGVVRAPLTGIALVLEMTANVTMLLPMLGACFMAMLIPTLMHDAPIYDSLRELTLERERARREAETQRRVETK
jgi:chloride channel protein, CIC family